MNTVQIQLETLIKTIKEQQKSTNAISLESKSVWTLEELCSYTGYKESYIYKLTSNNQIPYYQPTGKKLFFKRDEILNWIETKPQDEEGFEKQEMRKLLYAVNGK